MLYEHGEIVIEDVTQDPTYGLEAFQTENQCKSVYLFAIKDLDDRIIGLMGIHFIETFHKFTTEEWIFIRQKMGAIGNLMSNYLNNKKS